MASAPKARNLTYVHHAKEEPPQGRKCRRRGPATYELPAVYMQGIFQCCIKSVYREFDVAVDEPIDELVWSLPRPAQACHYRAEKPPV